MNYYIDSYYLDSNYLKNKLNKLNWKPYVNTVDFIYLDGEKRFNKTGKIIQSLSVQLKNVVNVSTITNKWILYKRLPNKSMMPLSFTNVNKVPFFKGSKFIIRPVEGWGGKDIMVAKTRKQLDNHLSKIKPKYKKEIVISEYIPNLLLYKGKIFHLRVYFVVSIINKKFKTYLVNYILTATAKKDYQENKETNKNVYDSHLTNTGKDIIFPDDFDLPSNNIIKIMKQIKEILYSVSNVFKQDVKCYEESKNCFEILGSDFMIDQDFNVKLLEINSRVSFLTYSKKTKTKMTKVIFDDILTQFINPVFYNKTTKLKNWTIIYE